ncbi:MAG: SMC-Scp complex subunit ScpB [Acidobacteriota bacterium]|nr:SMC-Scp complex subunit ScpB [Acidobacteriota bacterium]
MIDSQEMEAVVEAILFASPDPTPRRKILEVFGERSKKAAEDAIDRVLERYRASPGRGVVAEEVAGGVRLVTRPEFHGYLRKMFEVTGRNRLSMAALETLAIIAYRQPVSGPEIQELRTVVSSGVLKNLLEKRLIRIAGRKQVVGKPFVYATTREFLMHFGLVDLSELPPLEQFEEVFGLMAAAEDEVTSRPSAAARDATLDDDDKVEEAADEGESE